MLTSLDHIIIGVHDLASAASIFQRDLGLLPSGGGVHPLGGTANRIIVIGDTYLELIAMDRPEEAQESLRQRLARGEGYLNFVLSSNNIRADIRAMHQRNVAVIGPTPGELRSSDGRSRAWVRADIEQVALTQRYPFIIQHDSVGEERRLRLAGWTTPPVHPLGAIKVLSVTLAVENLDEASRRFSHIYGLQPSVPYSSAPGDLDAQVVSFTLDQSGQTFELAVPVRGDNGPDTLRDHLKRFGESVCRMTLLVNSLAQARTYLSEHNVPYADVSSERPFLWINPRYTCAASIVLQEK